ncbi:MAG: hypothetical protein C0621_05925 [Desulfuromonas sp.]|nr:MAG: hypothetical protein C0621_05925 [Desulfuromonas sp.]
MCRWALYFLGGIAIFIAGCAPSSSDKLARVLWPPPPDQPRLEFIGVYHNEYDFEQTLLQRVAVAIAGKTKPQSFKSPFGIVADGEGHVWVSDIHAKNLRIYDFDERKVRFFFKRAIFSTPAAMDLDESGYLYVADTAANKIFTFSQSGKPGVVISDPTHLGKPSGVAVSRSLGRIYVSDGIGGKVVVFDLKGNYLFEFGRSTKEAGGLYSPQGLALDRDGNVFVCDMLNARMMVFDKDGGFVRTFGERGDQVWQFVSPKDCAFDSQNNLYIVDSRSANLLIYTPEGRLLLALGEGKASVHPLGFGAPSSIFIDKNDRIYVADIIDRRFSVYQFLTPEYLKKNPIRPEEMDALWDLVGAENE